MKRYIITILLGLLFSGMSTLSYAQNGLGEIYFAVGEYEMAKEYFQKELSTNPAEANYYLGELAFVDKDFNAAKSYYEKGLDASAAYLLNHVGLGKLLLKSDPKAAEAEFANALGAKNKKNVELIVAIARAYYDNGQADKAAERLQDAYKYDRKSPLIYMLEGDMALASNVGVAAEQYEQSVNFSPEYVPPYIKIARIYRGNYGAAIEWLNRLMEVSPNLVLTQKYIGDLNYSASRFNGAIEAYKIYFAAGDYSVQDLTQYAASLYFTEQYDDALKLIEEGIGKKPDDFILNRLLMYSAVSTKDYEAGLERTKKFFSIDKGDMEYIGRDYVTCAEILCENDDLEMAIESYEKAVEIDSTHVGVYQDIAEIRASQGRQAEAAEYYGKYIETAPEEDVQAVDYFQMGRSYYIAATSIMRAIDTGVIVEEAAKEEALTTMRGYLHKAYEAFTIVDTRVPDKYLGVIFMARCNALLDPNTTEGLARVHYEKTAEIILASEERTSIETKDLLEAYQYLSYYYYVQYEDNKVIEAKAQALAYSYKMLELDPTNPVAAQLIGALQ